MKKLLCNTLIIIILSGVFCSGYTQNFGLSFNDRLFCYASSSVTRDELVDSFKDYCKSRNLFTNSSVLGASSEWLGTTLTNICNTLGIDMDYLQAQISKETGGNLGIRWLVTATGMGLYNRIFAELLQRESLSVGDDDVDKTVYSGEYFTDIDGNKCLVYYINADSGTYTSDNAISRLTKMGSPYKFSSKDIYDYYVSVYGSGHTSTTDYVELSYRPTSNINKSIKYYFYSTNNYYWLVDNKPTSGSTQTAFFRMRIFAKTNNSIGNLTGYGNPAIIRFNNILAFGTVSFDYVNPNRFSYRYIDTITNGDSEPTDVTVTTPPDKKILPDPPENPTTIYPDGGGGGGDDPVNPDPDDPVNPDPDDPLDPYDPTKPFPDTPDNPTPDPGVHGSPGSDGTITLPDFNFDIPDINWSLDGLQHKFPFSLPFDLYNACKLLNAEPQTPELDYTVDLVVYQWPIQMDLHWLDPAARVIRIFELLAFVVGLILITRHLIGG